MNFKYFIALLLTLGFTSTSQAALTQCEIRAYNSFSICSGHAWLNRDFCEEDPEHSPALCVEEFNAEMQVCQYQLDEALLDCYFSQLPGGGLD